MRSPPFLRIALVVVGVAALLGVLRFALSQSRRSDAPDTAMREQLTVGFLPVT